MRSWVVWNTLSSGIGKRISLSHTRMLRLIPYISVHTYTPSKGMWYRRTVTREKPQGCHYSCPFRDARGELPLKLSDRAGLPAQQPPHQIPMMPSGNFIASVSTVLFLGFGAIGWPDQVSLHEITCFLPRACLWDSKPQRDSQVPGFQEERKHHCLSPNKFTGSVYWRSTYTYKGYTSTMCAPLPHIFYVFPEIQGPLQLLPRNQTVCLQACTMDFLPTLWHKISLFTWDLQEGIPCSLWQSLNSLQSPQLAACLPVNGINNSSDKPLTQ